METRSRSKKVLPTMGSLDTIIDYERGLKTGEGVCKYEKHDVKKLLTLTDRELSQVVKKHIQSVSKDPHYERVKALKEGKLDLAEAHVNEIMDRNFVHGENENTRVAHGGGIHLFYMTSQCNLNCSYCYEHLEDRPKHLPEPPLLKRLVDDINKTDRPDEQTLFCIFGGEPMLEWKNCEYLMNYAYSQKHNLHFNITTNGILLSKPKFFKNVISFLESNPEIKQRVSFDISFDGAGNLDRVYYSGKDSTQDVLKAFKHISDYNSTKSPQEQIKWRARYTIHRANVQCFAKDILHIVKTYGPDRVVTSIDESLASKDNPEDKAKINWLLKEQIDFLRKQWIEDKLFAPVCHMFCDMCNSCGERKDHRFYYTEQGLAAIQNGLVRVGKGLKHLPDPGDKKEKNRTLPRVGQPVSAVDRLGIIDTAGQGAGLGHIAEEMLETQKRNFPREIDHE